MGAKRGGIEVWFPINPRLAYVAPKYFFKLWGLRIRYLFCREIPGDREYVRLLHIYIMGK